MQKILNNTNTVERQILILAAIIKPPISLDWLIAIGPGGAVETLTLLQKLCDEKMMAIYKPLGTGHYCFTGDTMPLQILSLCSPSEIEELASKVLHFFDMQFKDEPEKHQRIVYAYQITKTIPRSLDSFYYSVSKYLKKEAPREALPLFQTTHLLFKKRSWQRDEERRFCSLALELLLKLNEQIPYHYQKQIFETTIPVAEKLKEWQILAQLKSMAGQVAFREGFDQKASDYFDAAWNLATRFCKKPVQKKIALDMSEHLFRNGFITTAIQSYETTIGNLDEFPADPGVLRSCARLGRIYAISGRVPRGIGLVEASQNKALENGFFDVALFGDIMKLLIFLDVRRISDAQQLLIKLDKIPADKIGLLHSWISAGAWAYVKFLSGDLKACARYQKKAIECAGKLGNYHHKGPWHFEYMEALEKEGLSLAEMNCDTEIRRLMKDPDIYMKGVAYRVRALRSQERQMDGHEVLKDLEESLRLLSQAGAKTELAFSQIAAARLLDTMGENDKANEYLWQAWELLSKIDEALFPVDLRHRVKAESRETVLTRIFEEVGSSLGAIRDKDQLLKRIIDIAFHLVQAERGCVILGAPKQEIELIASRNLDKGTLSSQAFELNRKMMANVIFLGKEETWGLSGEDSYHNASPGDMKWAISVPLLLKNKVLGVIYLDGKYAGYAPTLSDINILKAIGCQVAMALDHTRAYSEIAELRDRLKEENRVLADELSSAGKMHAIIGESPGIKAVSKQILQVCKTDAAVLITGETGVGKELVARNIHRLSNRSEKSFIPINTASLPEELISSELFGHEKGAFTGAHAAKRGRFELANGGTLFLDDVQNLSLNIQAKLLRILQEKEFERLGGTHTLKTDFRLLAATNIDLSKLVKEKKFRSDFYYRLKVFPVWVPPLRERGEDILILADHFLAGFSARFSKKIRGISEKNKTLLMDYPWPGNVRELQHVIERAVILCESDFIRFPILPESDSPGSCAEPEFIPLKEMEKQYIISVLKACNWKVSGKKGAARILALKPSTLYSKIQRLGITKEMHVS